MIHQRTIGTVCIVRVIRLDHFSNRGNLAAPVWIIIRTKALISLDPSNSIIGGILYGSVGTFAL